MARSTYIYTAHHALALDGTVLIGAFTVKHEMVSAVQRWIDQAGGDPDKLKLFRSADGSIHLPDEITDQFTWKRAT